AANTTRPQSTATTKRSSRKPSHAWVPMSGIWKSRWNSAPKPSTIVAPRITNPQNTAKCATPGTLHFNSLRCPSTSATTAHARVPTSLVRPGSTGCPARANRYSVSTRRPASANASRVIARPTTSRTIIYAPERFGSDGPSALLASPVAHRSGDPEGEVDTGMDDSTDLIDLRVARAPAELGCGARPDPGRRR